MLSALDLARRIEAGELTPAQVVERCAEAIAAREAEVGAFVALDIEAARKNARAPGLKDTPLRGLPVAFKDIFDTADMVTAYGSEIYAGYRPRMDASLVAITRRAGGILLGKTVTTEFAHLDPGRTRNPHNLEHTPGGSSSGSAAGVAAGMMPIATASQTGGSTIRPASFCGIAGIKPSYRLLPTVGMKCVSWLLDTVGVYAAGIADVAFATAAMSGRDLRVDRNPPAAPRIGVLRNQPWPDASAEMNEAVATAARAAAKAGAKISDIELPAILGEAYKATTVIQSYEAARSLAFEYDRHNDQIRPSLRELIENGNATSADTYDNARRVASRARQALAAATADIDVILSPSSPGVAPKGLASTGTSTFNRLWTLMGTPCVNVPGLVAASGLPLGVQIIGRFGADRAALDAALFVESAIKSRG
jgi:Asp-tRNA(Asn)/Glu-tRNA(Gln) amidotransferase A subunit family amidase